MHTMNVEGLSRENVASHLQKYRISQKKQQQQGGGGGGNGGGGKGTGGGEVEGESPTFRRNEAGGDGDDDTPMAEAQ